MVPSSLLSFVLVGLLLDASSAIVLRMPSGDRRNSVHASQLLFPRSEGGPACKTDHGQFGRCVDVRRCYAARRAVRAGNHPVRCGWINNYVPKVCCHPEQVQRAKMVFVRPSPNRRRF